MGAGNVGFVAQIMDLLKWVKNEVEPVVKNVLWRVKPIMKLLCMRDGKTLLE